MSRISKLFSALSGGARTVSISDAADALLRPGEWNLGVLSPTRILANSKIASGLSEVDQNYGDRDQFIDVDEFALWIGLRKKNLRSWDDFGPATDKGWFTPSEIAGVACEVAQAKGIPSVLLDADGVARVAVAVLDEDGDGRVSKTEYEAFALEVAAVVIPEPNTR